MRAEQARRIPIVVFLERAGIKPAKVTRQGRELWYSSPIRQGVPGIRHELSSSSASFRRRDNRVIVPMQNYSPAALAR